MAELKPGRGSDQFPLRLPDGMRDRIKAAADENGRSMNSEIVDRLEASFEIEVNLKDTIEKLEGSTASYKAAAKAEAEANQRLNQAMQTVTQTREIMNKVKIKARELGIPEELLDTSDTETKNEMLDALQPDQHNIDAEGNYRPGQPKIDQDD